MVIYYFNEEYESGKHGILGYWAESTSVALPDTPQGCSVLELDERYNRKLARSLVTNHRESDDALGQFYVDANGQLRDQSDNIVAINPNSQKEAYKLSQLYGLTQAQLETYIDNNVTNLAEAKDFIKKLSAVVLWLVKQTRLDE